MVIWSWRRPYDTRRPHSYRATGPRLRKPSGGQLRPPEPPRRPARPWIRDPSCTEIQSGPHNRVRPISVGNIPRSRLVRHSRDASDLGRGPPAFLRRLLIDESILSAAHLLLKAVIRRRDQTSRALSTSGAWPPIKEYTVFRSPSTTRFQESPCRHRESIQSGSRSAPKRPKSTIAKDEGRLLEESCRVESMLLAIGLRPGPQWAPSSVKDWIPAVERSP